MGLDTAGSQFDPDAASDLVTEARQRTGTDRGNGLRAPQSQALGGATDAGVVVLDPSPNGYGAQHDAELRAALGLFAKAAKRGFDLIGSLLLVVLFAPV